MNLEEIRLRALSVANKYDEVLIELQNYHKRRTNSLETCDQLERIYLKINLSKNHGERSKVVKTRNDKTNDRSKYKLLRSTLDEIISTEKDYLESLHFLSENFLQPIQKQDVPISNQIHDLIQKIHQCANKFLESLPKKVEDLGCIGSAFKEHKVLFEHYANLYSHWNVYMRFIESSQIQELIKEIEIKINQPLGFTRYILKPIQRIPKYELFLNNIKRLTSNAEATESVKSAAVFVNQVLTRCNSLLALSSIEKNKYEEEQCGKFIFRIPLKKTVRKGKHIYDLKIEDVELFIFEKVLILCAPKNQNECLYISSICTEDLRISNSKNPMRFILEDFKKKKTTGRFHTIELTAFNKDDKEKCVKTIEKILWDELENLKRIVNAKYLGDNNDK